MKREEIEALARRVAGIMEPEPTWDYSKSYPDSLGGWHCQTQHNGKYPRFNLDGDDPRADAVACHLMKARLIEWCSESDCISTGFEPWTYGKDTPWFCTDSMTMDTYTAPTEVIAVAQALVAVAEAREKQSKEKESPSCSA